MNRFILCASLAIAHLAVAAGPTVADLTIAHETFVLPNGLTVIVHEDHSVPLVAVNTWYHVGSRDEKRGRTGFAHLFEHFFFNGSENYPHGFREAMDDLGANNRNGTTNTDRTNFFEDVPTSALERTLYLEADRMGFLSGQVTQAMLERERGVVQNEKRQGENQPYGRVSERINELMYPSTHPYNWSTIGSMEDLNAAKLDDIKQWYASYYGPNNAVLSLAGDITVEQARALTTKYYGPIPASAPVARLKTWVPELAGDIRDTKQDRVPQTRVYRVWHAPPAGDRAMTALELFANVLAGSESGPLTRRLVFETKLATKVSVDAEGSEIAGAFAVVLNLQPGADPAAAERELDAVLSTSLAKPMAAAELDRARSRLLAKFARDIERLGGFGGRSDVLAESATYLGDSRAYLGRLEQIKRLTAADVQSAARATLSKHKMTLTIEPFPTFTASKETFDRKQLQPLSEPPKVTFPTVQRATLSNGLKIMLLERHSVPLINAVLAIDAGGAADRASTAGTARFATELLLKGTTTRDAFQLADERDALGAELEVSSSTDLSMISLKALRPNLGGSLALLADIARRPAFRPEMIELQRKAQLAAIAQQQANPSAMVQRLIPGLLYGREHAYGNPGGGLGTSAVVGALSREALVEWHGQWFRPGSTTLVVAGDVTMAQLQKELEKSFGDWKAGTAPAKALGGQTESPRGKIYVIDKPGAPQSVIAAAHVSVNAGMPEDLALETVMRNFGGMATSRLNRNLRLDKHWSYGAGGGLSAVRGRRAFTVVAPVQTDKTKESMIEILSEIRGLAGARPLAGEEYESIMRSQVARLPGRFETLEALTYAGLDLVTTGRSPEYYADYATNLQRLTPDALNKAAAAAVAPGELVWVVVGDAKKIEPGLRDLKYGEVIRITPE